MKKKAERKRESEREIFSKKVRRNGESEQFSSHNVKMMMSIVNDKWLS